MKLVKNQNISASLTDFSGELSIFGALRIMEDAITEFMGDLKIDGLTSKRLYNAVWVFTKTKMKFLKSITWDKDYTVSCFFSKIANATMNIDVAIKNAEGNLCVYSRTEICALDATTGRIRKVSTVGVDESITTEPSLCEILFTKIDAEDPPVKEQVKIGYTNIDFVGHTNNLEYVRFMLNTYSVKEIAERPIREMQIVYMNQSFEGDTLTLHKGNFDGKDIFVIKKDDKNVVKSEILRDGVKA